MSGVADRLLVVGKFAVTPTGLTVEGQPTFEEWRDRGDVLHLTEAGLPWAIGDWWAVGEHKYGDRASRAVDPTTGADRLQRFMNYAWVSKKFETSRRREVL